MEGPEGRERENARERERAGDCLAPARAGAQRSRVGCGEAGGAPGLLLGSEGLGGAGLRRKLEVERMAGAGLRTGVGAGLRSGGRTKSGE